MHATLWQVTPPETRRLTVERSGSGKGSITSTPGGIECGNICAASFVKGTSVTLAVIPEKGSRFTGWRGPCSGTGTCVVSMDQAQSVRAIFRLVQRCTVPNVIGQTLVNAKKRLSRAHCRLGTVTGKPSKLSKRGRILAQRPRPAKRLPNGAKVNVVVGRGRP